MLKRVLVTGGNGFIAGHTIEALAERGYEVFTNVRSQKFVGNIKEEVAPSLIKQAYFIDIRDKVGIRSIVEKVDGVINLAGILGTKNVQDAKGFYENNLFGALNIFDACLEFNTPVVQIGVGNWFETNNYSNSKYAAERELIKYAKYLGLNGSVVRGLNAYGERQKVKNTGKIVPTFVTQALENKPLTVYGGKANCGIMDMIYVKDLANILVDVLEKTYSKEYAPGQVFEAGTGKGYSVYEIAEKIIELSGSESKIEEIEMRSGESLRSEVVAKYPYDYEYSDLDDSMYKTIQYYKNLKD